MNDDNSANSNYDDSDCQERNLFPHELAVMPGRRRPFEHDNEQQRQLDQEATERRRQQRRLAINKSSNNNCHDEDAPHITTQLQLLRATNSQFTTWKCKFCDLNRSIMTGLSGALKASTSVRNLELDCHALTPAEVEALGDGIRHSKLESLRLIMNLSPHGSRKSLEESWRKICTGLQRERYLHRVKEIHFKTSSNVRIVGWEGLLRDLFSLRKFILEPLDTVRDYLTAHHMTQNQITSQQDRFEVGRACILLDDEWNAFCQDQKASFATLHEFDFKSYSMFQLDSFAGDVLPLLTSLRMLRLEKMNLTKQGADTLSRSLTTHCKLESLTIEHGGGRWYGQYGQLLSKVLRQTESLAYLELSRIPFKRNFVSLLAKGLQRNSTVTSLVLDHDSSDRDTTQTCVKILFEQGLNHNTTITQLKFKAFSITDEVAQWIGEHWHADSAIRSFFLDECDVGEVGALALLDKVANHPAMQEIGLSNRYFSNIGYEGLRIIAEEQLVHQQQLSRVHLKECAVWRTNIHDAEMEAAKTQEVARCRAGEALVKAVQHNHGIHCLSIEGNAFPSSVIKQVEYYTGLNRTGVQLLNEHHGLATSVWSLILAKCQDLPPDLAASLTFFYLREQPHLVQPPFVVA